MATNSTLGWGRAIEGGIELWDANPTFFSRVTILDRLKLFFYPKKWFLYRAIEKDLRRTAKARGDQPYRILDMGCGTGAALIDLFFLFGDKVELYGADVIQMQIDLAKEKLRTFQTDASIVWYDGITLPFPDGFFDAVYSSDVLGHVPDVPPWIKEVSRVIGHNGLLAMFSESALGRDAVVRKYLKRKGVIVDPHAEFHISLYSKKELYDLVENGGLEVSQMLAGPSPWFFLYANEAVDPLTEASQVPLLRAVNRRLARIKQKCHPYSTAFVELFATFEMMTLGRFLETQGYIIIARKR